MKNYRQIFITVLFLSLCILLSACSKQKDDIQENDKDWFDTDLFHELWDRFPDSKVKDDWFLVKDLPGDVTALFESGQSEWVISYLIAGENYCLLWDTGMGIGNIRKVVEELTDLPVIVLNSHVHPDHIGGNYQFDEVWCYELESAAAQLHDGYSHEEMMEFFEMENNVLPYPSDFSLDDYYVRGKEPTGTVRDGQQIDLGGRTLEVLYMPGHSSADIMLMDKENRILFTGDAFYPGAIYLFLEDSSLSDYVTSMEKATAICQENEVKWIYGSHNGPLAKAELLRESAEYVRQILDGEITEHFVDESYAVFYLPADSLISFYFPDRVSG